MGDFAVLYVEHGAGRPVLVLHGARVDHREAEACFEPVFGGVAGFRRIYPGRVRSATRAVDAHDRGTSGRFAVRTPRGGSPWLIHERQEISDGDVEDSWVAPSPL